MSLRRFKYQCHCHLSCLGLGSCLAVGTLRNRVIGRTGRVKTNWTHIALKFLPHSVHILYVWRVHVTESRRRDVGGLQMSEDWMVITCRFGLGPNAKTDGALRFTSRSDNVTVALTNICISAYQSSHATT
jgi:hypothetical protein